MNESIILNKSALTRKRWATIGRYFILLLSSFILLLPFFSLLMTAFKSNQQVITDPGSFWPAPVEWGNFGVTFSKFNFLRYAFNSSHIAVITVIGVCISSSLVAYAFARFQIRESGIIFSVMLASIMVPAQVIQIPMYSLYNTLGWIGTYIPFWIPPFLGGGIVNVFLIRQFILGLSGSLFESAEIDGASELRKFTSIALPLSRPVIFTVAIFTFTGSWNDFFTPLVYLNKEHLRTLALGVYFVYTSKEAGSVLWNILSAANIVMIIPIVALFFLAQKYFIEGINVSGIKG